MKTFKLEAEGQSIIMITSVENIQNLKKLIPNSETFVKIDNTWYKTTY